MPGLLEDCQSLYGTSDLYELLDVEKSASNNAVKKAYHKLSLRVHPDRVGDTEKDEATKKFQVLGKIYMILTDKDKRAVYDETGCVDEEDDCLIQDRDWYDYWRLLFHTITVNDIKDFENKYKGSDEELTDLREAYTACEGDMGEILHNVLCSTDADEERFTEIINQWITDGDMPQYKAFTHESDKDKKARKRKAAQEAREAEAAKAELGIGADDSLRALIANRQQSRAAAADDFFSQLEQKYAKPTKTKKKGSKS